MVRQVTVAVSTINQWALDFHGNAERIVESIKQAKDAGAVIRSGPSLEISGYSCEDHFYERDTLLHSWEVLQMLMQHPYCNNIIVDVGMPVMHKNATYNCRVVFYNRRILLIRPKMSLFDDGNYRETRWFTAWRKSKQIEDHTLPQFIQSVTGQVTAPFGDAVVSTKDTCFGYEMSEEMWNPDNTHFPMSLDGVEIFLNGSGSYSELRKSYVAIDFVKGASAKCGGCYLFSNLRGCDGERYYFNGWSCVLLNGQLLARSSQYNLSDVEVSVATLDLDDVATYRNRLRNFAAVTGTLTTTYPRVHLDIFLCDYKAVSSPITYNPLEWLQYSVEQEICLGPACWLWDYLRRSNQNGYLLALSGGMDSSASACIAYSMCHLVVQEIKNGATNVLADLRRIVGIADYMPKDAKELCGRLLFTCYMGTENSTGDSRSRAEGLAKALGSHHLTITIDSAVTALVNTFSKAVNHTPKFCARGGTKLEDLALQNIQARSRMVLAYMFAQLLPETRGHPGQCRLLVLGSTNADEALRGNVTKHDCSSVDVNPVGGIAKVTLRRFLKHFSEMHDIQVVNDILAAPPSAELAPLENGVLVQRDDVELGMSYEELSIYGLLRKGDCCGPYSMFTKLVHLWRDRCSVEEVAEKVKYFFRCYAINRHKVASITPAFHAESHSNTDTRCDLRPILYNVDWRWQFEAIERKMDKFVEDEKPMVKGQRHDALESIVKRKAEENDDIELLSMQYERNIRRLSAVAIDD